jgi:RNA polymerase sigma-B factor
VSVSPSADLLARRSARERSRTTEDGLLRLHASSPSPQTRDALVRRYLGLARHIAGRLAAGPEPWEDLFQVACTALVLAIDRFDPGRGTSFSSFAVPTIQGEVKRHLRDRSWTVRPTRTMLDLAPRAEAARDSLTAELGRAPDVADVARALGVEPEKARQALLVRRLKAVAPLSRTDDEGAERSVLDTDGVEEAGFERAESRATLAPLLRALSPREQRVVMLRFVEDRTQSEIAEAVGISQMHVSRLLARSLDRMAALAEAA